MGGKGEKLKYKVLKWPGGAKNHTQHPTNWGVRKNTGKKLEKNKCNTILRKKWLSCVKPKSASKKDKTNQATTKNKGLKKQKKKTINLGNFPKKF